MNLKWDTCKITFVKTEYVFGILTKAEILNWHILGLVGMVQCTIGTFGYFYNHDTRKGPKAPKVLFQNSHLCLQLVLGSITYYIILEGF